MCSSDTFTWIDASKRTVILWKKKHQSMSRNIESSSSYFQNISFLLNRDFSHCVKRSIFQIFWRLHCCAKFLSFELETSNFGDLFFFIFFDYAKFQKDWTTFILDILQWSPLWIFGESQKQKTSKGGPL